MSAARDDGAAYAPPIGDGSQLAPTSPRGGWLERYEQLVGARTLRALEALARKLKGHTIVMVNTT